MTEHRENASVSSKGRELPVFEFEGPFAKSAYAEAYYRDGVAEDLFPWRAIAEDELGTPGD